MMWLFGFVKEQQQDPILTRQKRYNTDPEDIQNNRRLFGDTRVSFHSLEAILLDIPIVPKIKRNRAILELNTSLDSLSFRFSGTNLILHVNSLSQNTAECLAIRTDLEKLIFRCKLTDTIEYLLLNSSLQSIDSTMKFDDIMLLSSMKQITLSNFSLKQNAIFKRKQYKLPSFYKFYSLFELDLELNNIRYHEIRQIMKTLKFVKTLRTFTLNKDQRYNKKRFYFRGQISVKVPFRIPNIFDLYLFNMKGVSLEVVYPQLLAHTQRSKLFISRLGNRNIFSRMGKLANNSYITKNIFLMSEISVKPQVW